MASHRLQFSIFEQLESVSKTDKDLALSASKPWKRPPWVNPCRMYHRRRRQRKEVRGEVVDEVCVSRISESRFAGVRYDVGNVAPTQGPAPEEATFRGAVGPGRQQCRPVRVTSAQPQTPSEGSREHGAMATVLSRVGALSNAPSRILRRAAPGGPWRAGGALRWGALGRYGIKAMRFEALGLASFTCSSGAPRG